MSKKISVLGSTGSIGVQALDVIRDKGYTAVALAANGSNLELVEKQVREFKPRVVAINNEEKAKELKLKISDTDTLVLANGEGIIEAAAEESADIVLNAIVGIAGLKPTLAAIKSKKDIALANKETLVAGGDVVLNAAKQNNIKILPVDSEHSAIFQCLQGVPENSLKKILLTASGGPFFGKKKDELKDITPAQALKHPNWDMGAKITIDSATLMNKGLEVIEAVRLFGVGADDIEVLVHRQSIVHSAVELVDGGVIAQLGAPDMCLPIQYALTYPERLSSISKPLSLTDIKTLTFEKPDTETFECLATCIDAVNIGSVKPAAANGANEMAVSLFLNGKIGFLDIGRLVRLATDNQKIIENYTLNDVLEADKTAREFVLSNI